MKTIFNIFSQNKIEKKQQEKPKIIVDYREKNALVVAELHSLGLETELKQLKVADYLVGNVAVERKTVSDFISSMINRRLLRQLEELQQYENRILIVEGIDEQELYSNHDRDTTEKFGVHPNSIRGFLLSILLRYKVPIIFTRDYSDTARFLSVMARRKSRGMSLNVAKKSLNKKERMQFILEGFPGIGPKTSKKLLKRFKTIHKVINAPEQELREILGKKTDLFLKIISQRY